MFLFCPRRPRINYERKINFFFFFEKFYRDKHAPVIIVNELVLIPLNIQNSYIFIIKMDALIKVELEVSRESSFFNLIFLPHKFSLHCEIKKKNTRMLFIILIR